METFKPQINSQSQEYRNNLARQLGSEPDFLQRRELLKKAKETKKYEEAEKERKRWRAEYVENRFLAQNRLKQRMISESDAQKPQYEITDDFLSSLKNQLTLEKLQNLSADPSPFVRYDVAKIAQQLENEKLLALFENDDNSEIKQLAKRAIVELEIKNLLPAADKKHLFLRLSDFFADVPAGEGKRFFIIQPAQRKELQEKYKISDDDLKNLQNYYHFKKNEKIDLMWWGLIDVRHLPNGKKIWLLEEIQSDILQKTKNKDLKKDFFEQCKNCAGKGVLPKAKKEQERCSVCQGAGTLPIFPKELLKEIKSLGMDVGVDFILMPTSESMVLKYAGLLKLTKAKLLYDSIPEYLGFKKRDMGSEIEFGQEDGGDVRTKEFWALAINKKEASAPKQ